MTPMAGAMNRRPELLFREWFQATLEDRLSARRCIGAGQSGHWPLRKLSAYASSSSSASGRMIFQP